MNTGATRAIEDSYATMNMSTCQGTFSISEIDVPNGVTYKFQGEPDVTIDGQGIIIGTIKI